MWNETTLCRHYQLAFLNGTRPLLLFDLTRVYDSDRASGQLDIQDDETTQTYSNVVTPRKEELNTGWDKAGAGIYLTWKLPGMSLSLFQV